MASLGTFSERALAAYDELVRRDYKEKKVKGGQGTEYADNLGVGENDSSFIDEDQDGNSNEYSESWDFTTCIRSNGTRYGIAPGKKCRKGSETKGVSKEDKQREAIKRKVQKAIDSNPRMSYLKKALDGRKNALRSREDFVKENKYPAANPGMKQEIERIQKEIKALQDDIVRERRRIAKRVVDGERKETKAQRLGRLSATKARAEKVLTDLRKEKEESDTERSARQGVFNKSKWD
jgi:hypothetical protein